MPRLHAVFDGSHILDLTDLEGALVHIGGDRRGMRTELEGFDKATFDLTSSTAQNREAAGVPPDVYDDFLEHGRRLSLIREKLETAARQLEVLVESEAFYADAQQNDISIIVKAMRARAKYRRDAAPLNHFENLLKYNGQIGHKSARTKRKQAEEAAVAGVAAPRKRGKRKPAKVKGRKAAASAAAPAAAVEAAPAAPAEAAAAG